MSRAYFQVEDRAGLHRWGSDSEVRRKGSFLESLPAHLCIPHMKRESLSGSVRKAITDTQGSKLSMKKTSISLSGGNLTKILVTDKLRMGISGGLKIFVKNIHG